MKKTRPRLWIAAAAAIALLIAGTVAYRQFSRPSMGTVLERLKLSQVESVSVYRSHFSPALAPEAVLDESDAERVVSLLRQVRLSGEPTQDFAGWQGMDVRPWFHVTLKNGMEFDFRACSPFFLVNTGNLGYVPHQRRENTIMGYQSPPDHDREDYDLAQQIGWLHSELEGRYFE